MSVALIGRPTVAPAKTSITRHPAAKITVGSRFSTADGEFIYVTAGVALGAVAVSGEPVSLAGALSDCRVGDSDTGAFLGISEAPFASGESGYIRVKGQTLAIVESGAVAGDELQLSSTAGKLKKITTSGSAVGVALAAADNASAAHVAVYIFGR